jgi:hypothetical protein
MALLLKFSENFGVVHKLEQADLLQICTPPQKQLLEHYENGELIS